jgi:hypothetical protein
MSVSGSGLSGGGGGNVDLQTIIAGGPGFAERLKQFSEAAKAAEAVKAQAKHLLSEAETTRRDAEELLAQAQRDASDANAKNAVGRCARGGAA